MISEKEFVDKYCENSYENISKFLELKAEENHKRIYANSIFREIVGRIETADPKMWYRLKREEAETLPNEFLEEKLKELKQNYVFLDFKQGILGEVVTIFWDFKDEEEEN